MQRHPFSYYGTRAAARIGAPMPAPSIAFPNLSLVEAVTAHPDYQAAAFLSRAGLLSEAAIYARRLNAAFRRDDAVALLAARASEVAGDHTSAATLMSSYFGPYLQRLPPTYRMISGRSPTRAPIGPKYRRRPLAMGSIRS